MTTSDDRRAHWQQVWAKIDPEAASWYQPEPALSLALIEAAGLRRDAGVVDVGAGQSLLIDALAARGWVHLAALDVAPEAIAALAERLGALSEDVTFIESDVLEWRPVPGLFELWHDRACLHFLTDPGDQAKYVDVMATALVPGGIAILGGFAPDGPQKCSGLPVTQHDRDSLAALLGPRFELVDEVDEQHQTPGGRIQAFRWSVWRRL